MEGVDYYFVSKERFEEWIRAGELLEWALVYGEYKGIPKSQAGRLSIPLQCHRASSCTHPESIQHATCVAIWQTPFAGPSVMLGLQDKSCARDILSEY